MTIQKRTKSVIGKPQKLSEDSMIRYWWEDAVERFSSYRNEALKCYQFYRGAQWTEEEIKILEEAEQPAIVINRIQDKVNQLVGLASQNKIKFRCRPRGTEDADLAFVASATLEYVADVNDFAYSELRAFMDLIVTGMGWLETRRATDLFADPIKIGSVGWEEMLPDPAAREPDFRDGRFVFRFRWVEEDELLALFPSSKKILDLYVGNATVFNEQLFYEPSKSLRGHWWDKRRRKVMLLETLYKSYEEATVFWDGQQALPYQKELEAKPGLSLRRMVLPRTRVSFIVGEHVLEDTLSPYLHESFWYTPMVAVRDYDGLPFGIVSNLIDPQSEINKRRSKMLHYLTAKRVLAEKGAVDDPDEFMEQLMKPSAFLEYRRNYKVDIQSDIALGAQHFTLMQEASNEMNAISGIQPDMQGQPTNARTGAAINIRSANAINSLAIYFNARLKALKKTGELLLDLTKQFYRDERVVDVTGEQGVKYVINQKIRDEQTGMITIRNDIAQLRADVSLILVNANASERQIQLTQISEVLKSLPPEAAVLSLDLLIDATDVPQKEEIKQRLKIVQQALLNNLINGGGQDGRR